MREDVEGVSPKAKAEYAWRDGGGLQDNPYDKGTEEYKQWMLSMATMQHMDFNGGEKHERKHG